MSDDSNPEANPMVYCGPSSAQWEAMKKTIHQIYIEEAKTLKDVKKFMSSEYKFNASEKMYNTHFKKWGPDFDKNKKRGRSPGKTPIRQGRGRRTRPRRVIDKQSREAESSTYFNVLAPPHVAFQSLGRYRNVEIALHSLKNYTGGLFHIFTWDNFKVIPPTGAPDLASKWQHIADQCFGAAELIMSGRVTDGGKTLNQVCDILREVIRICDPAMMVKFWRICYILYKTCFKIGDFLLVDVFLRYVRRLVEIYHRRDHPLFHILDAIIRTPREDLFDTLKVSYLRIIKETESHLGEEHAIVLHMWSNYFKYFDTQGLFHTLYILKYRRLLEAAESQFGLTGETTIVVLHGFMYAEYYNVHDRVMSADLALKLYSRVKEMPCLQEKPWWCLPTQSFALAAKLLAILSREDGQFDSCRCYLEEAITKLGCGDRECRTRALMLANMLRSCLMEWGENDLATTWSKCILELERAVDKDVLPRFQEIASVTNTNTSRQLQV